MTAHDPATDPLGPIVDYESLRNREGVPYHEDEVPGTALFLD